MKYFSKEELLKNLDAHSGEMADYSVGRVVKSGFGLGLVNRYLSSNKQNIAILDVASAGGGFADQLYGSGYRNIYGTDILNFRNAESKSYYKEFKVADLNYEKLPWPDKFFDALAGWCVLPHLENPYNFLREAHRVLKDDGLFFITMPNIFSFKSRWTFFRHGDIPRYKSKNNHLVIFAKGVFMKSVLNNFDLMEQDYFIRRDKKFFKSTSWLEKLILILWPFLKKNKIARELVGYNIAYVFKKH